MIASTLARLRSLWRGLFRRSQIEADMADEFRHHLELRTEDLMREGFPPEEAARRARIEFGHVDSHKTDARQSRGLGLFDEITFSALDVKLGMRMLRKYPGLSVVSVVGMAVAIAIGAGVFGFFESFIDPSLPLHEGDRVVSIQNASLMNPDDPDRPMLHDFAVWREELQSVTDLGAYTSDWRNLIVPGGPIALVRIAQMTAAGFRVARVPPVLGRPLLDEDERDGAPPVLVIAHEEWQRRLGGDPNVIGRQVRLGTAIHTVVGVMPEGFRFPVNHRYWVPLKLDPADHERGGGPELSVFGRLASGVTLDQAQAELTTFGLRSAAEFPETHRHLRPWVLPYTSYLGEDIGAGALRVVQVAISLLLVVIAVNVAILVYARTAMRAGEIVVRTALGASRKRIVTQLFAEALVLSGIAAAIGLTIAGVGLEQFQAIEERSSGETMPFWIALGLSPGLVAYASGMAVLGAIIVGVLPALKATGRRVQTGLQQLSTRGSGLQLGRTWTVLIVAQVAIAVAVLPFATYAAGLAVRRATATPDYPIDQFLRAYVSMEHERGFEPRFRERAAELVRRLEAEPAVRGVTFGRQYPGGGDYRWIELEPAGARSDTMSAQPAGEWARVNDVDVDLFDVFGVPVLAGRGFTAGDRDDGANAAIVDRVFAERVGGDVLGRRVRWVRRNPDPAKTEHGPWLEIVGVVPAFTVEHGFDPVQGKWRRWAHLYLPLGLERAPNWLSLAIRMRGAPPEAFVQRVREVTAEVDPTLHLHDLWTAEYAERISQLALLAMALVVVGVTVSVLLLSAAGIYAMMSFTVAKRRREIGIRIALGADPRRLLTGIFARATMQIGAGVLVGLLLAAVIQGPVDGKGLLLLPLVAAIMMAVGLLAAWGPARRGLAVQPTEALREE